MKFYHLMPVACHGLMYTLIFYDIFAQLLATWHSWWRLRDATSSGWGQGCWSWILRWWWRPGRPWSQIGRCWLCSCSSRPMRFFSWCTGGLAVHPICWRLRMLICCEQLVESCASNKRVLKVQILVKETITPWVLQEHKGPGPWGFGRHTGLSSMKFL